jgi:tartrate dehydratase beta subunit/fumarate hydratase class I family protein
VDFTNRVILLRRVWSIRWYMKLSRGPVIPPRATRMDGLVDTMLAQTGLISRGKAERGPVRSRPSKAPERVFDGRAVPLTWYPAIKHA